MNDRQRKKWKQKLAIRVLHAEQNQENVQIQDQKYVDAQGVDMYPFEVGRVLKLKIPHVKIERTGKKVSLNKWIK